MSQALARNCSPIEIVHFLSMIRPNSSSRQFVVNSTLMALNLWRDFFYILSLDRCPPQTIPHIIQYVCRISMATKKSIYALLSFRSAFRVCVIDQCVTLMRISILIYFFLYFWLFAGVVQTWLLADASSNHMASNEKMNWNWQRKSATGGGQTFRQMNDWAQTNILLSTVTSEKWKQYYYENVKFYHLEIGRKAHMKRMWSMTVWSFVIVCFSFFGL